MCLHPSTQYSYTKSINPIRLIYVITSGNDKLGSFFFHDWTLKIFNNYIAHGIYVIDTVSSKVIESSYFFYNKLNYSINLGASLRVHTTILTRTVESEVEQGHMLKECLWVDDSSPIMIILFTNNNQAKLIDLNCQT